MDEISWIEFVFNYIILLNNMEIVIILEGAVCLMGKNVMCCYYFITSSVTFLHSSISSGKYSSQLFQGNV